jgi:AGCS family alanine or glycine:cation symporter
MIFRLLVLGLIFWASQQDLATVFSYSDLTMGLLAVVNLIALWQLFPLAKSLLRDYEQRLRRESPMTFKASDFDGQGVDPASWTEQAESLRR